MPDRLTSSSRFRSFAGRVNYFDLKFICLSRTDAIYRISKVLKLNFSVIFLLVFLCRSRYQCLGVYSSTTSAVDVEGLNRKIQRIILLAWNDVFDALLLQIELAFQAAVLNRLKKDCGGVSIGFAKDEWIHVVHAHSHLPESWTDQPKATLPVGNAGDIAHIVDPWASHLREPRAGMQSNPQQAGHAENAPGSSLHLRAPGGLKDSDPSSAQVAALVQTLAVLERRSGAFDCSMPSVSVV